MNISIPNTLHHFSNSRYNILVTDDTLQEEAPFAEMTIISNQGATFTVSTNTDAFTFDFSDSGSFQSFASNASTNTIANRINEHPILSVNFTAYPATANKVRIAAKEAFIEYNVSISTNNSLKINCTATSISEQNTKTVITTIITNQDEITQTVSARTSGQSTKIEINDLLKGKLKWTPPTPDETTPCPNHSAKYSTRIATAVNGNIIETQSISERVVHIAGSYNGEETEYEARRADTQIKTEIHAPVPTHNPSWLYIACPEDETIDIEISIKKGNQLFLFKEFSVYNPENSHTLAINTSTEKLGIFDTPLQYDIDKSCELDTIYLMMSNSSGNIYAVHVENNQNTPEIGKSVKISGYTFSIIDSTPHSNDPDIQVLELLSESMVNTYGFGLIEWTENIAETLFPEDVSAINVTFLHADMNDQETFVIPLEYSEKITRSHFIFSNWIGGYDSITTKGYTTKQLNHLHKKWTKLEDEIPTEKASTTHNITYRTHTGVLNIDQYRAAERMLSADSVFICTPQGIKEINIISQKTNTSNNFGKNLGFEFSYAYAQSNQHEIFTPIVPVLTTIGNNSNNSSTEEIG